MSDDSALADLVAACRAAPKSAALVRALMAEAASGEHAAVAFVYLEDADPASFEAELRRTVADFLTEGGRDEAARRWRPEALRAVGGEGDSAVVVDLGQRRERGAQFAEPPQQERLTFADVGGLEDVKQQIRRRIIAPLEKPGLFSAFKRRAGGGLLFYGPPGCGKTMLAQAAAGEAHVSFLSVRIPDILDRWLGESEKHIAAAFTEAKARKPAILFFDEIEALAARRRDGDHNHTASMVSTFLSEFDGLAAASDALLVVAATNVPWMIDTAFRRPGRFDRVLFVPPPDKPARLYVLRRLLEGQPTAPGLDMERYATGTSGFSGADLLNLVETAIDLAIDDSLAGDEPTPLARKHFDAALSEVKPTTAEWLATARNYAKYANEGGQYDEVLAFLGKHAR
ncbi:MAG: ATP-binding protein [Caulobacteraceae bacterium]